jgi:chorismate mutase
LRAEIKVVDTKVTEMDRRLTTRIDALSERMDMIKDVGKLKIEVAELKRRR